MRESVAADLATAAECGTLGLTPPSAVLRIASVSYDTAGLPALLGRHAASTAAHLYLNEVS